MSYVGPVYLVIFSCWGVPVPYLELFWVRRSWVGPVYLVIFSCWGGPVPYLELFWVGPVKIKTLYHQVPACPDADQLHPQVS